MLRGENILGAEKHLLVKFIAGSHPRKSDLDVSSHGEAGESDQVGGDIHDANGLAHVEKKDLTATTESAGLQYKLYGFGDGHEVALQAVQLVLQEIGRAHV